MIYQIHLGRIAQASQITHKTQVFKLMAQYDWAHLKHLGVTHVYLLGCFDYRGPLLVATEQGVDTTTMPERLPSPFALRDHRQTHPDLGSIDELKHLISTLHHKQLKVILDLVPNHRGLDHPWLVTHPEYFARQSDNQLVREFSGDVAKLDYTKPELRAQMIQTIKYLCGLDIDGLRVDMAHFVPMDFWKESIGLIKTQQPDFLFVAEAYPESNFDLTIYQQMHQTGFDYLYHGVFFNLFEAVITGQAPLENLTAHLNYTIDSGLINHLVHYPANHDDFPSHLDKYRQALFGLCLFLPGMPFLYQGSAINLNSRLAHHYYQDIDLSQTELAGVPDAIDTLTQLKLNSSDTITHLEVIGGLIRATTPSQHLWINLSTTSQELSQAKGTGLVMRLTSADALAVGAIEVFAR